MVKKCAVCKEEKDESNYTINRTMKDGLQLQCKSCTKKYNDKINKKRNDRYKKMYNCPDNSVYAFYREGEMVYIGSSAIPSWRIGEHYRITSNSFDKSMTRLQREATYNWKILYTGDDFEHMEKVLIHNHKPQFNKIQYVQYNKNIKERTRTGNWRSSLSIRFRELLRFLRFA